MKAGSITKVSPASLSTTVSFRVSLVKSDTLLAKVNLHVRKTFRVVQERNVQVFTHHSVNHFTFILSIRLKVDRTIDFMDHPALYRDRNISTC